VKSVPDSLCIIWNSSHCRIGGAFEA